MITMSAFLAAGALPSGDIDRYFQSDLHDATFVARVLKADQRELSKINTDFGQSYRFETTTIHIKEPFKLRIDAKVDDTSLLYIENGPIQLIKIPRVSIRQRSDLSNKPGRRQTPFDFGLLTPALFEDFYQARFVRTDRATGEPVFDITYVPHLGDTSRSRIWVDATHRIISKREWYGQDGHQEATFYYTNPERVNGVWLPTRLEVKNIDSAVAGITRYESIKVNTGLPDSEFETK